MKILCFFFVLSIPPRENNKIAHIRSLLIYRNALQKLLSKFFRILFISYKFWLLLFHYLYVQREGRKRENGHTHNELAQLLWLMLHKIPCDSCSFEFIEINIENKSKDSNKINEKQRIDKIKTTNWNHFVFYIAYHVL